MAMTNSERQLQWVARIKLRADMFDVVNAQRVQNMRRCANPEFLSDQRPEVQHVRKFFEAYPRCGRFPDHLDYGQQDGWYSSVDRGTDDIMICAAMEVALSEITSVSFDIVTLSDGGSGRGCSDETVAFVKAEVAEMRRLGIWSAQ